MAEQNAREWLEKRLDHAKLTGCDNVCVGPGAGGSLTSGSYNVCVGAAAGLSITTESRCVCVGDGADIVVGRGDGQVVVHEPVTLALGATTVLSERLFARGLFLEKNRRRFANRWVEWAKNRMGWTRPREG